MKSLLKNKLFLLGLLIRFLVMPFTGHFDIRGINFAVYNLPFKHILNVYRVACCQPVDYFVDVNFGREYFIYPPLTYFTLGAFQWLLKPFYGQEFVAWIQGYGNHLDKVLTHPHVFRYLFLMKLPYLFFDLLLLWLLLRFFTSPPMKQRALAFWWLNPITIYLPYIWGQFDIIPTFFTLLAVFLLAKRRPMKSALVLGIAASFKNYPLMFLPFLVVIAGRTWKDKLKLFFTGLAPFILTTMPFWSHPFFRKTVLFSWQSQKMFDFMWGIGGDDGIYPFIIGYALIFLFTLFSLKNKFTKLHLPIIMTLMWFYATVNFHHQWFLWVVPFLVIVLVKHPRQLKDIAWWILGLWLFRLLEIQANVTVELFAWIDPFIMDLPKTRYLLSLIYDIHRLRNIVNSFYVATALWLSWYLVTTEAKSQPQRSLV